MIALVDCNSFYCNCERLFRPKLKFTPVLVLSNNDGCAISRTGGVKDLGIKMGAPYFEIKDLCKKHGVAIFSSNFSLYTDLSRRVMQVLETMTDFIDVYSVDEAFISLKGIFGNNLRDHAKNIKKIVYRHVGVPVGVGVGRTKVLAKAANFAAKKLPGETGVVVLDSKEQEDSYLARVPIGELWGVGRANAKKMQYLGIKTAKDLRDYKNEKLIRRTFSIVGLRIQKELQGEVCFELVNEIEKKKEIMCSRTFGRGVFCVNELKEAIACYTSSAAERLREQESVCQSLEVFFRTNAFKDTEQYYAFESFHFEAPTLDSLKLIRAAHTLVEKVYRPGIEYKKAGIRLRRISDQNSWQLGLFEHYSTPDQIELMETLDRVNKKEGERTLAFAACGVRGHAWKMKREFKSPRYTTSWTELPKC